MRPTLPDNAAEIRVSGGAASLAAVTHPDLNPVRSPFHVVDGRGSAASLLSGAMASCWGRQVPYLWVTGRTFPERRHRQAALRAAEADGWNVQGSDLPEDPRRPEPGWHHCFRESADFDRYTLGVALTAGMARDRYLADLDGETLTRALALFRVTVGVDLRRTPETTASDLMTSLHRRSGGLQLRPAEMPPPALVATTERDLYWVRSFSPLEMGRRLAVAWDVNAAYLGACSSLTLGVGAPHHSYFAGGYDGGTRVRGNGRDVGCGYFLAEIRYAAPPGLPSPFPDGRAWVTTPTVQLALDLGATVHLFESYVWFDTSRPLEPFYKRLRAARETVMAGAPDPACTAVLMACKRMWGPFLGGRVSATRDGWDRSSDPLYRPDWRHFVIATTRARVFRALLRLEDARPFAVHTDALYFAADDELAPEGLRVGRNPGTFKAAGVVPLSTAGTGQRPDLDAIEDAMRGAQS